MAYKLLGNICSSTPLELGPYAWSESLCSITTVMNPTFLGSYNIMADVWYPLKFDTAEN